VLGEAAGVLGAVAACVAALAPALGDGFAG